MAYKMITIDLDDTLLSDDLNIDGETKEVIKKAVDQGVLITLATGRMFASAAPIASQLELNVPIITYQGALVKSVLNQEVLYEKSVSPFISQKVYQIALENNVHMQIYQNDMLFTAEENEKIKQYSKVANVPYTVKKDFFELTKNPSTKLLYFDEPDKLDRLKNDLDQILGNKAYITKSKPYFLEVLHPEASKGHAVRYLAKHFGISPNQIIAIGDSYNDLDMLQAAGLGVAMGNAIKELKMEADFITDTNNNQGVKKVIEKFLL